MNLIGEATASIIRKRVYDFAGAFLNTIATYGAYWIRPNVDLFVNPVDDSIFDAVESVMFETHQMHGRGGPFSTVAAGWNPGQAWAITVAAPMIITAPPQIGGQP